MNWYQAILIIILIVSSLFIGWYLKDIYLAKKRKKELDKQPLNMVGVKLGEKK